MLKLAENQLNLGEPTSVIRPFHTPVLVVLTTGKSQDELVKTAVDKLIDRYNICYTINMCVFRGLNPESWGYELSSLNQCLKKSQCFAAGI